MISLIEPGVVIPMHYNTWDLIAQDPVAWSQSVQSKTGVKVLVLKPGQSYSLEEKN